MPSYCYANIRISGDSEDMSNPRHSKDICRDCLVTHATTAVNDGRLFVSCPAEGCGRTLQTRELREILPPRVFENLVGQPVMRMFSEIAAETATEIVAEFCAKFLPKTCYTNLNLGSCNSIK